MIPLAPPPSIPLIYQDQDFERDERRLINDDFLKLIDHYKSWPSGIEFERENYLLFRCAQNRELKPQTTSQRFLFPSTNEQFQKRELNSGLSATHHMHATNYDTDC